jgi:uncharacterized membrane protein
MSAEGTNMQREQLVVGVFDDRVDAEEALRALKAADFEPDRVSAVMLQTPHPEAEERHRHHVDETTGILAGGAIGGLAGWLIGTATVAVPGLGALVAAGALVGALGGAGIGAATGGLIGYLVDLGLSREEAQYYHKRVRHGAALVTVHVTDGRVEAARTILQQHGAHDFHTRPAS